jgi:hypothetical protein
MPAPVLVLAGVGLLSVFLLAIFAVLVIGIQRGDRQRRGHLFHTPRCYSDALSRQVLVRIRYSTETTEENSK